MTQEVEVRLLGQEEIELLRTADPDVFDDDVDPARAAEFLLDPRHHLAVAIDGGLVVGIASAVHYVHPDKPPELWINEVGVAESHQRRGLASALLRLLRQHAVELGCADVWVLTEPHNAPARALYEAEGAEQAPSILYSWKVQAGKV